MPAHHAPAAHFPQNGLSHEIHLQSHVQRRRLSPSLLMDALCRGVLRARCPQFQCTEFKWKERSLDTAPTGTRI